MKKLLACILLGLMGFAGFGQTPTSQPSAETLDSIRFVYYRMAALKYPTIRQAGISTDIISEANVRSNLRDGELFQGKAQITRVKAYFNLPISSWGKNTVSATFGVINEHTSISNVVNPNSLLGIKNMDTNFTTFNFSGSFSRSDSVFGKPVTYSATVSAVTNASLNRMRLTGMGFATVNLIRNPVTSLSVGAVLIADRSSIVPGYLLISYSRKFSNLGLELLADLPARVIVRKELSAKSFLSAGSELGGNMFFFNPKQSDLPTNAISTSLTIKSGVTFEHLLSKSIVLGVSAGIMSTPMTKALNTYGSSSDYFIKTKSTSAPYVNFSVSFLPFWKGLKL
ncbi:MAG: hypothetical protein ABIN80_09480 [Dyadobacter sp.]|uniref:hypothetical protein n=1 Tax=Dyadobacter sp. TaxID=1914288 RepID=UPI0032645430